MAKRKLRLEDIRLSQIRLRKSYGTEHIERLAADIKERGLLHPLIVNSDGSLVDGAYRYLALQHLGVKELDYDTEKRLATLPREKDYHVPDDSMAANVLRIGATDLEKAEYLKREIESRILIDDALQGVNARQFIIHVENVETHNRRANYTSQDRAELQRILNSLTLEDPRKASIRTARRLLEMLDWPEDVREDLSKGMPQKHAEAIARLEKRGERNQVRRAIREKDWTQRETTKAVEAIRTAKEKGVEKSVKEAILKHDAEPKKVAEVVKRLKEPELIEEALRRTVQTEEEAEEVFEDNLEIAEDIEAGRLQAEGIKIEIDADVRRLARFEELRNRITGLRGFDFDMIKDDGLRNQAVDCIRQINDFCEALLIQLAERWE